MEIYELYPHGLRELGRVSLAEAGLREKHDLQRLLGDHIEAIAPDTLVLTEEFSEWDDSKRRIDLVGLDKHANLVVIELKRDEGGAYMDLQATRYAAMISATMTFEKAVQAHGAYLRRLHRRHDPRAAILRFLGWNAPHEEEFARNVRIVLVAPDFSKELTTTVIWLTKKGLDIRCVRIEVFTNHRRILVGFQPVIPLPVVDEYLVHSKGG
ncbi:MAG: hypothetical protein FJ291_13170 [Planctomycetes bacterium]|nr:hypothetical protein [Planctomycetota bacterium]